MKIKFAIFAVVLALVGCGGGGGSATLPVVPNPPAYNATRGVADYTAENTLIKTDFIPNEVNLNRSATFWGVGTVAPLIPAFDGKGLLLASWTPIHRVSGRPN